MSVIPVSRANGVRSFVITVASSALVLFTHRLFTYELAHSYDFLSALACVAFIDCCLRYKFINGCKAHITQCILVSSAVFLFYYLVNAADNRKLDVTEDESALEYLTTSTAVGLMAGIGLTVGLLSFAFLNGLSRSRRQHLNDGVRRGGKARGLD